MKHFATDTCHPESGSCRIEGSRRESLKVTSVGCWGDARTRADEQSYKVRSFVIPSASEGSRP